MQPSTVWGPSTTAALSSYVLYMWGTGHTNIFKYTEFELKVRNALFCYNMDTNTRISCFCSDFDIVYQHYYRKNISFALKLAKKIMSIY